MFLSQRVKRRESRREVGRGATATERSSEIEFHLQIALKFLEEGKSFVEKDHVQASEKLYKAAEEVAKALALHFNLEDILAGVEERGSWSSRYLRRAAFRISRRLGKWFRNSWRAAWELHVEGFHEASMDPEEVKESVEDIEVMVEEARRIVAGGAGKTSDP